MRQIKFDLVGFDAFRKILGRDGLFIRELRRKVPQANRRIGREIITHINTRAHKPLTKNAKLTIAIKGGQRPIRDMDSLVEAVEYEHIDWANAWVGINESKHQDIHTVAVMLHEGRVFKVTERMRGMFFALYLVSIGKKDPSTLTGRAFWLWHHGNLRDWRPLAASTTTLRYPERPFMDDTFRDDYLRTRAKEQWTEAVRLATVAAARAGKRKK
jgi:hypothetical protein